MPVKDRAQVTFVPPAYIPPDSVSVVGDVNEWKPLKRRISSR
ncbi:hypothetical protein [Streptomyces sp. NBC_01207]|nr:hypothetical protein OG457_49370 [Streptomyces sp. NBC_01207]